jgi:amino acid adenylation domain-containing protein
MRSETLPPLPDAGLVPAQSEPGSLMSADADPTLAAVCAPDAQLTYGELADHAAAVAATLRDLGVAPGDLVGVCVERSAALIAAVAGVRQAGAAYVALDPAHPDRRLQEIVADSGAQVLLTGAGTANRLALEFPRLALPLDLQVSVRNGTAPHRVEGLAYVVYTSGSTGTPKGVLVPEAGLANLVAWHRSAFGLSASDRCTQIAAPGFDAFAWEVWPALACGASLHIPPAALRTDPTALRDWLVRERITVSFVPTAVAEALFALPWPAETQLRFLLTGGDRLSRRPPPGLPFTVVNNYGLSEATVVTTSGVVTAGDGVPTIGRPIDGVDIRIVDDALRDVPDGEAGELLVGGISVAIGYLGQPELTDDKFITLTTAEGVQQRWYRTGDSVRRDPDGELHFAGRLDDQVQIRGNRVEPGEIAAVLEQHPDVQRCVVQAWLDAPEGPVLVAYLRAEGAQRPSANELRDHIATRLPTWMLPAECVWVDEFSLTPNGKVDTSTLPRPGAAPAAEQPTTGLEGEIAEMVADVLGLETVNPDDNFILLGGHSLLAAQLMVRILERYDVELPLRTVFERPTISELAREVQSLSHV